MSVCIVVDWRGALVMACIYRNHCRCMAFSRMSLAIANRLFATRVLDWQRACHRACRRTQTHLRGRWDERHKLCGRLSQRACDWRVCLGLRAKACSQPYQRQPTDIRDASDWADGVATAGAGSITEACSSLARGLLTDKHMAPSQRIPGLSHVGLPKRIFALQLYGHKAATPSCLPV